MNDLQIKQKTFLEDEIKHFNSKNRGVNLKTGLCSYAYGCAIGRHIKDEKTKEELDFEGSIRLSILYKLPQELQELGVDFLSFAQGLHDIKEFWDEDGLSDQGLEKVNEIKQKFGLE